MSNKASLLSRFVFNITCIFTTLNLYFNLKKTFIVGAFAKCTVKICLLTLYFLAQFSLSLWNVKKFVTQWRRLFFICQQRLRRSIPDMLIYRRCSFTNISPDVETSLNFMLNYHCPVFTRNICHWNLSKSIQQVFFQWCMTSVYLPVSFLFVNEYFLF